MSCQFCGHNTPHSCWDANEAASCGNYAAMREGSKQRRAAIGQVERIIARRAKGPTKKQIEAAERRELARLKAKYEK